MNRREQFVYQWRKFKNRAMASLALFSVVLAVVPLFLVFFYTVGQGIGALNIDFFIQMPTPVGDSGGGMANALVGTLILIVMGSLIGVPVGVLAGVYLAEFGRNPFGVAVWLFFYFIKRT